MRKVLLATIFALVVANGLAHAEIKIIPAELVKFAEIINCSHISDFYERPGPVNPPFVYGYLPGNEEDSIVFWCKNTESSKHPYSLVFLVRDSEGELRQLPECPFRIEWDNPPRGLSVYKDRRTTLKGFINVRNPNEKVPEAVRLSHNAIMSYYDGVSELFYCHKGAWFVRQSH
jgi:hypothetical protein